MSAFLEVITLKALDSLTVRANVTAENIANANTANFRRRTVTFESALAHAAHEGSAAVGAVAPKIVASTEGSQAPGARLDLDLTTAAATSARYSALIEIMGRQMQIDALATSEGRS